MEKISELFANHLTNWGLVWFCLFFWGSIFNAILLNLFNYGGETYINYFGYLAGLLLGFYAKQKSWGWLG